MQAITLTLVGFGATSTIWRFENETVNRIFPVLFLLLSLTVAAREIPELYNLVDDPSNDGQIFNWQGQMALCTKHRIENKDGASRARIITFTHVENLRSASVTPARTGQDILDLVGSLRT